MSQPQDISCPSPFHRPEWRQVLDTASSCRTIESASQSDPKTEVMRQDVGGRQIGSDQVQQRGVKSLPHTFKELAAKLSSLPAFTMRLGEVTLKETFLTVSMEGWATNDGVSWHIKVRSVIITARNRQL